MEEKEKIKVFVEIKDGRCACICQRGKKGCNKDCEEDVVIRDRYSGWKETMNRDRYGR